MANRCRSRLTVLIGVLVMGLAMLGVVGEAAAQAPPPEGSDPGAAPPPAAGGQPDTAPPPKTGQPAAPPPGAGQPGGAHPPGGAAPAPPPRPSVLSIRARETQLKVEMGGEFFVFGSTVIGNGPAFKLSAHWLRWWGPFMIGGGPSLRYSYMTDGRDNGDYIHQMTLNGEFIIGGGIYQKFAIYGHLLLGFGAFKAYDGDSGDNFTFFMARAVGGIGGWAHITRWLSIGALVDVGWPGTVQVLATVGFHFGRRL